MKRSYGSEVDLRAAEEGGLGWRLEADELERFPGSHDGCARGPARLRVRDRPCVIRVPCVSLWASSPAHRRRATRCAQRPGTGKPRMETRATCAGALRAGRSWSASALVWTASYALGQPRAPQAAPQEMRDSTEGARVVLWTRPTYCLAGFLCD